MNELLHSPNCKMTSPQFVAWLRGVANSIEELVSEEDTKKLYHLCEWLVWVYDTQTRESCPCETPSNHQFRDHQKSLTQRAPDGACGCGKIWDKSVIGFDCKQCGQMIRAAGNA